MLCTCSGWWYCISGHMIWFVPSIIVCGVIALTAPGDILPILMKVAQLVFLYRTHTDLLFHGFYLDKCMLPFNRHVSLILAGTIKKRCTRAVTRSLHPVYHYLWRGKTPVLSLVAIPRSTTVSVSRTRQCCSLTLWTYNCNCQQVFMSEVCVIKILF